jgi:hypothetical protein
MSVLSSVTQITLKGAILVWFGHNVFSSGSSHFSKFGSGEKISYMNLYRMLSFEMKSYYIGRICF